jgi:hypothetical protein
MISPLVPPVAVAVWEVAKVVLKIGLVTLNDIRQPLPLVVGGQPIVALVWLFPCTLRKI